MFRTDNGGFACKANIKVSAGGASLWGTKLSQIKESDKILICTYSLPHIEYAEKIFMKNNGNAEIVCHEKFKGKADALMAKFPNLKIRLRNDVHAKFVVINDTVWCGSENFGKSTWIESCIGIKSKEVAEYFTTAFYLIF